MTVDTKSVRMAEFLAEGSWKFINYFVIMPPVHFENGRWVVDHIDMGGWTNSGVIHGKIMGENIFSCGYCGTSINGHFTLKNRETGRLVNVGCVCIDKIRGLDKKTAFKKGFDSVTRKVQADFKRKVHTEQLLQFLDDNMKTLSAPRHKKCDEAIKKDAEFYWRDAEKEVKRFDEKGQPKLDKDGKEIVIKLKRTTWERKDGADQRYDKERNYWENFREQFKIRGWQPKTMLPVIQEMIVKDGFDITVPALRKLSKQEQVEQSKQVTTELNEYMEKVGMNKE